MNFTTGNLTSIKLDLGTAISRNSRTLNNPIVGLLLAAGILARVAQAKQSATPSASAALLNPWLQLHSIASGATPVQVAPSPAGAQHPPYGYYPPVYPLAASPSAYPWWYAVDPFSFYPNNGHHPQIIHVHGGNEEHEEQKDGINYPEDHETVHPHHEHHDHLYELDTEHPVESGEQSAPGSYEAESANVDKQTASNVLPITPNNEIKPVEESVEESKLEPVTIQTVEVYSSTTPSVNELSVKDEVKSSTMTNATTSSTPLNQASRTVQSIVKLLHKFEGNYSRIKMSEPLKQRQNQHQLLLNEQKYTLPKNSVTNILVQLNTTSASELLPDDDRIAEASDIAPSQLEETPLMLAMAGASNTMRRQHRPNEPGKQGMAGRKGTTTTRRPSIHKNHNKQKPLHRKTTTYRTPVVPAYEDDDYEYEYTTPRYKPTRRTTARRRPDYRRSTAPPRKYDYYDYDTYQSRTQTPALNRRRPGGSVNIYNKHRNGYNNRMKPAMMSAYDDDVDDAYGDDPSQYYSNDDYAYRPAQAQAHIDYTDYRNDKNNDENDFVARQGTTNQPDYVDENTTTTQAATTLTQTAGTTTTPAAPTQTDNPVTTMNATTSVPTGYPYGPYGPPVQPGYGYGPSNGNENISITYGPPSAAGGDAGGGGGSATGSTGQGAHAQQYIAAGGPSLDWYNQYTKQNVFKRIQDLLTPNNFYSPQYDNDKYNYNDNTF